MSELSTVAIKDGHRGHLPHASRNAPQPEAERADRISRLAGLERVTARQPTPVANLTPGAVAAPPTSGSGYFDATGNPLMGRERSTVGSASATGSVGGRTTWASGSVSDVFDRETGDRMSDSGSHAPADDGGIMELDTADRSSVGALSDDGAATNSLVGFGEGARTPARNYSTASGVGAYPSPSPLAGKHGHHAHHHHNPRGDSLTPTSSSAALQEVRDARMIDGLARDGVGGGNANSTARATAERIMSDRIGAEGQLETAGAADGRAGLGRFDFESK